ncbi:ribulose-bisphosphate carboxylase large chain [Symbiobacterium terraclitae]|uniref:Ribulose-bisphosphate carboxylase large chain n=1 Tax=Symbiobacterium terraclitae TaxID=557451 RepID=A0ABS4JWV8_9FIRM|nr:RuBisCO large subunit C-terminal-like domain-containing protein [Symbiobacterium terraclitae]MBP2018949.1 ribulose-bisphosphate carboxylase large chain [Symbiobacterium terraclitae]
MMLPNPTLNLSGDRFAVHYRIAATDEARQLAEAVCLEQTVEFPADLVPSGDIRQKIVGRIESLEPVGPGVSEAVISYAVETTGFEFTQFLNVLFGNTSIKPGIRVERFTLPESLLSSFRGPRFGVAGLREYLGVFDRPLLCTALKPLGLSAADLANLAYHLALGGIDIIKDDHGLANQAFAPFEERVKRCAEAVERASRETGRRSIYMPHVAGPVDTVVARARLAKEAGAGGLLVSPGLVGFDTMRLLAADDSVGLPIMSHPALQGSFVTSPANGISHFALFGQIARLAGADATVYPNWGGRFSFSQEECGSIAEGARVPMGHIKPIFPTPGGGMSLGRVPEMLRFYGKDVIFLIGGGLFQAGPDLVANCRSFLATVSA